MKRREIIYSSLIIALGIFAFIYAGQYANTSNLGSGNTGGDFFPRIMAGGLILTGICILLTAVFGKKTEKAPNINWLSLLVNIAMLLSYFLLLKPLGFIVDTTLMTAFLMYRMGCRKYLQLSIWSIVMPTLIFCVFYYLLYVSLPMGILAPILPRY